MLSSAVWLAMNCRRSLASFRRARLRPLSSSCCWWAAAGGAVGAPNRLHPDHNRVAQELEFASNCMAANVTQAGCEVATKNKVPSNSVSVGAELQLRLAPLGVQASRAEPNFGIDLSSGKRVSTAVQRARLETSKGRVRRIRKFHGRSSIPLRQCVAMIARVPVLKANHCGVAVTGPNETQLQQSGSQVASSLAKRLQVRVSRWCSWRQETLE